MLLLTTLLACVGDNPQDPLLDREKNEDTGPVDSGDSGIDTGEPECADYESVYPNGIDNDCDGYIDNFSLNSDAVKIKSTDPNLNAVSGEFDGKEGLDLVLASPQYDQIYVYSDYQNKFAGLSSFNPHTQTNLADLIIQPEGRDPLILGKSMAALDSLDGANDILLIGAFAAASGNGALITIDTNIAPLKDEEDQIWEWGRNEINQQGISFVSGGAENGIGDNIEVAHFLTHDADGHLTSIPGDFDGDGVPEIFLTNGHQAHAIPLDRLTQTGNFVLADVARYNFIGNYYDTSLEDITSVDFDGDGLSDLVFADRGREVKVLFGSEDWQDVSRSSFYDIDSSDVLTFHTRETGSGFAYLTEAAQLGSPLRNNLVNGADLVIASNQADYNGTRNSGRASIVSSSLLAELKDAVEHLFYIEDLDLVEVGGSSENSQLPNDAFMTSTDLDKNGFSDLLLGNNEDAYIIELGDDDNYNSEANAIQTLPGGKTISLGNDADGNGVNDFIIGTEMTGDDEGGYYLIFG